MRAHLRLACFANSGAEFALCFSCLARQAKGSGGLSSRALVPHACFRHILQQTLHCEALQLDPQSQHPWFPVPRAAGKPQKTHPAGQGLEGHGKFETLQAAFANNFRRVRCGFQDAKLALAD